MPSLIAWLVQRFQIRCRHPSSRVTADILEGDILPTQVQWCRLCGAVRRRIEGGSSAAWRVPDAWWWR